MLILRPLFSGGKELDVLMRIRDADLGAIDRAGARARRRARRPLPRALARPGSALASAARSPRPSRSSCGGAGCRSGPRARGLRREARPPEGRPTSTNRRGERYDDASIEATRARVGPPSSDRPPSEQMGLAGIYRVKRLDGTLSGPCAPRASSSSSRPARWAKTCSSRARATGASSPSPVTPSWHAS
jgi:hypothetical protein